MPATCSCSWPALPTSAGSATSLGRSLPADVDVRPLFGALSLAEQDLALAPSPPGRRRVVLATDIAETSLTVDGVSIVVDSGQVRSPRYDRRSGLTRLHTGPTSRASADQRAGRAGRTAPGVAHRLWSDGRARPPTAVRAARDRVGRSGRTGAGAGRVGHACERPRVPRPASGSGARRCSRPPRRARGHRCRSPRHDRRPGDGRAARPPSPRAHDARGHRPRPRGRRVRAGRAARGARRAAGPTRGAAHERRRTGPVDRRPAGEPSSGRAEQPCNWCDGGPASCGVVCGSTARDRSGDDLAACGPVLALAYPDRLAQARGDGRFRLRTGVAASLPVRRRADGRGVPRRRRPRRAPTRRRRPPHPHGGRTRRGRRRGRGRRCHRGGRDAGLGPRPRRPAAALRAPPRCARPRVPRGTGPRGCGDHQRPRRARARDPSHRAALA